MAAKGGIRGGCRQLRGGIRGGDKQLRAPSAGGVIRRDEALLTKFIDYLDCGRIERASTRPDLVNFSVSKFSDIKDKVIPFF